MVRASSRSDARLRSPAELGGICLSSPMRLRRKQPRFQRAAAPLPLAYVRQRSGVNVQCRLPCGRSRYRTRRPRAHSAVLERTPGTSPGRSRAQRYARQPQRAHGTGDRVGPQILGAPNTKPRPGAERTVQHGERRNDRQLPAQHQHDDRAASDEQR